MITKYKNKQNKIVVIGLGYVGLPIALAFAKHFKVIGFDISKPRIDLMREGIDPSKELESEEFQDRDIYFSADAEDLKEGNFFIVTVPTPVDEHYVPDLSYVLSASRLVGSALKKGDVVVYESTVFPGCTEEDCLPILEEVSGLKVGKDFKLGYSPERINPGDKEHTITKITKVVSGNDEAALEIIADVYGSIIEPGVFKAKTIKAAEAAKVIENTQRDLNIALMNELAVIFDKMGISTHDVLEAAGTKWNFLKFFPGLVGGHCIGVDPYYLTYKAQQYGYSPEVILSGRRVNNNMPAYIAKKLTQSLLQIGKNPSQCKILIMGLTFKEDVSDIRNSKVADLAREIMGYSVNVHLVDPNASPNEVAHEYKLTLIDEPAGNYDGIIVAVAHADYRKYSAADFRKLMNDSPILFDIKGICNEKDLRELGVNYWRL
jgi:UDP-N-acetyl-D-galactosamine dehydrogenase